jgi:ribonuclease HI
VKGIDPTISSTSSPKIQKFYAIRNGRKPGIYLDWPSALEQIKDWAKPRFKSFLTRAEAEAFINNQTPSQKEDAPSTKKTKKAPKNSSTVISKGESTKEAIESLHVSLKDSLNGPPARDQSIGSKSTLTSDSDDRSFYSTESKSPEDGPMVIYTDGSALGNGNTGSVGGVGVYFGPQDSR